MTEDEKHTKYGIGKNIAEDNKGQNSTDNNDNKSDGNDKENKNGTDNNAPVSTSRAQLAAEWQKISECMQVDVETFGKERGLESGGMLQNLKKVNKKI